MDSDSSHGMINKFHKSRQTILEVLEDDYDTSEYNNISVDTSAMMYKSGQTDMLLKGKTGKKIFVKYYLNVALKPELIVDDFYKVGSDESGDRILDKEDDLIIIIKDEPNDTLKYKICTIYSEAGIFITVINIKRLQYNILKHQLVPAHSVLNKEEHDSIITTYRISSLEQLPEISRFDPVAMLIGLRPGQICRINRNSKTAVSADYYRHCVNN